MKIDEYRRGYRDGVGFAVKWLYAEARRMNDPNAKAVLNLAADRIGSVTANRLHDAQGTDLESHLLEERTEGAAAPKARGIE